MDPPESTAPSNAPVDDSPPTPPRLQRTLHLFQVLFYGYTLSEDRPLHCRQSIHVPHPIQIDTPKNSSNANQAKKAKLLQVQLTWYIGGTTTSRGSWKGTTLPVLLPVVDITQYLHTLRALPLLIPFPPTDPLKPTAIVA